MRQAHCAAGSGITTHREKGAPQDWPVPACAPSSVLVGVAKCARTSSRVDPSENRDEGAFQADRSPHDREPQQQLHGLKCRV